MQNQEQSAHRYGSIAMLLHWLTVVLVVIAFILGPGGSEQHIYAAAMDSQRHLHETIGLSVFFLTLIRLGWRWLDTQPQLPPLPPMMVLAARFVQYVLYILLLITPMTAITGAWLEGHPVDLLFGINIGPWFGPAHALGDTIAEIHGFLGDTILWLSGAHALAALFHQFVRKDDILVSMLPDSLAAWLGQRNQ